MSYFEEKKYEWGKKRWTKFTGSDIFILMGKGSGSEVFSKGALSYIEKKAVECVTEYEHNEFQGTWDMREGKRKEPEAHKFFQSIMPITFEYFGDLNPNFREYGKYAGCSADGVAFKDVGTASFISEYKCPTRDVHFERIRKVKNDVDLRLHNQQYYGQCQFAMMSWDCDMSLWVSYNEYFPLDTRALIVEVPKNKDYCQELDIRIKLAAKRRDELVEDFKNSK